ncbi:MAG: coproporphyrinogen III oxidase family protein [Spirochaetaceae bacterium]|nr:coproporphyrinogen III oxidase family protein [Spirochaetaceae bacterium]
MHHFETTGGHAGTAGGWTVSLYFHIPFCAGSCAYCDFYSIDLSDLSARSKTAVNTTLDRYGEALERDLARLPENLVIPTVYLGGGTPSVLGAPRIGRLLSALRGVLRNRPAEITVEANPESVTEPFLRVCRETGVTRVSLGIQTFHEPSRKAVGRTGSADNNALSLVREYFGGAFSVDLMTGLPLQDERVLLRDIEQIVSRGPEHISLYALTAEHGSPLEKRLPDPDAADALWIRGRDALRDNGYEQYEVSNFSLPGKQSAHNIRYWRMESWIGLGAAASSTLIDEETGSAARFTFAPDIDAFIRGEPPDFEALDRNTLIKETVLMGFRYRAGPDAARFHRRFGVRIEDIIPRTLAAWREKGLLEPEKPALTEAGLLFLNRFLRDAFTEIDRP